MRFAGPPLRAAARPRGALKALPPRGEAGLRQGAQRAQEARRGAACRGAGARPRAAATGAQRRSTSRCPAAGRASGALHPVTLVRREIEEIFLRMGYSVADGPEVEDDWHNFEALNIPPDHPARDAQDTFYLPGGLAAAHPHLAGADPHHGDASSRRSGCIIPGRVYRRDSDLRHSPMFHQVEGLVVDEGITFGHLKATLEAFLHALFDPSAGGPLPAVASSRSPSRRPRWTSPASSAAARAARMCSGSGWIEILGLGHGRPAGLPSLRHRPRALHRLRLRPRPRPRRDAQVPAARPAPAVRRATSGSCASSGRGCRMKLSTCAGSARLTSIGDTPSRGRLAERLTAVRHERRAPGARSRDDEVWDVDSPPTAPTP